MVLKLDRSKGFAEVFNDDQGRRFFQDGSYFDSNEELIGGEAPRTTRAKKSAEPVPAADQISAQLDVLS